MEMDEYEKKRWILQHNPTVPIDNWKKVEGRDLEYIEEHFSDSPVYEDVKNAKFNLYAGEIKVTRI